MIALQERALAEPATAAPAHEGRTRRSLGLQLALRTSALTAAAMALTVALVGWHAGRQVADGIAGNLAELARQTTSRLDRAVYERHREIQLVAQRLSALPPRGAAA